MVGRGGKNIGGLASRRRRRMWIGLIITLVVLLAVGAGVVVMLKPWSEEFRHGGLTIADPPVPVRPFPQVAPAPDDAPVPSSAGLAAVLAPAVSNPDLGGFAGSVTDADTGTVLWSADAAKPMVPSSTAKILTTAAALLTLPEDQRVETTVVAGAVPGEIVLVGGGDPTLTAQRDGKGYYPNGPNLSDLVTQIRAAQIPIDSIVVDTSLYSGPSMAQGWDPIDIPGGSIAPIEPLMIDGGRLDPLVEYSPRSATPGLDVGRRLAAELGLGAERVRPGTAPAGAKQIATVSSAPLGERLHAMMVHSDNVLAETIGREIAQATGGPASFAGAAAAVQSTLEQAGFDLTGVSMHDTSGLSVDDRIPAQILDRILATAARDDEIAEQQQPKTGAPSLRPGSIVRPGASPDKQADDEPDLSATLAPLLDDLPVAGATGSLTSRYVVRDRDGAGWVRAKTGTLSVASTLVGYVLDSDGRVLTFALMSSDRPPEVSRPALDAIAATLRTCGCS
ncbi:D-alanyl-D-alanine carboxypeptidase [Nocardia cyriacigeorgica]|uniref:D-alanyl-D-alanine carboxypeptidase n=2 Tax=Nocardia cyriacigeorgica TaxID=135487 RepID=A0A6P1DF11_9NOCA|nr:D-alanyl-D-alanine carboxypeptidase [Nocardia cyriacigeorgica]NEW47012.1 D-alanyl-D-alanine carboxypeptidase [Nocardia cyriacigeorgica]NEW53925.1 D-alanyl-D-alanine carboxypeptidase [Nocardia cyriacigeorgica]